MAERLAVEMRVKLSTVGLKTEMANLQKFVNANFKLNIPTTLDSTKMNKELENVGKGASGAKKNTSELNEVIAKTGTTSSTSTGFLSKMTSGVLKSSASMLKAQLAAMALRIAIQTITNAFKDFVEIQDRLTEINIVTEGALDLSKVLDLSMSSANELGIELSELLTITSEVGRAFGSATEEQVNMIATSAALLSSITDLTSEDAISGLIAILRAYKLDMEDVVEITDKLVKVANNYAVSAETLSSSLNKSAASATEAGIELDFLLGMTTAISEVTQESGDTIGNSLKTITTRLRTNTQALSQLQSVGVEVYGQDGQLRSAQDILTDLNGKWETLTENQRTNIAVAISGQRQTTRFNAIMSEFHTVQKVVEDSQNSNGAATDALAEKYFDISRITAEFKNNVVELGYSLIEDTGIGIWIGGLVSLGSNLIKIISSIVKLISAVPVLKLLFGYCGAYAYIMGEAIGYVADWMDKLSTKISNYFKDVAEDFKTFFFMLIDLYNDMANSWFGKAMNMPVINTDSLKSIIEESDEAGDSIDSIFSGEQLDGMDAFNDVLATTLGITQDTVSQMEKLLILAKGSYGKDDAEYQRVLNTLEEIFELEEGALEGKSPEYIEEMIDGYQLVIDNQELYLDLLAKGLSGEEAMEFLENLTDVQEEFDELIELEEERHEKFVSNIEDEKEKFKSIIDSQIDEIKRFEDALEFESTIGDIMDERTALEKELLRLENDNSLEAEVRRKQLAEELAELEKELAEENRDRENELREEQLENASDIIESELDGVIERAEIEMDILRAKREFLDDELESLADYKEIVDALSGSNYSLEDLMIAIAQAQGGDVVGGYSTAPLTTMSSQNSDSKVFDLTGASFSLSPEQAGALEDVFTNILDGNKSSQIIRE